MKLFLILAIAALAASCAGESICGRIALPPQVEVTAGEVSLGDLLPSALCPALRAEAKQIRLGSAPLMGSVRVLDGDRVRTLLSRFQSRGNVPMAVFTVPDRIVVRRSGIRASCSDIAHNILLESANVECGADGSIPRDAELKFTNKVGNPESSAWQLSARCVHAADCVPFRIVIRGSDHAEPADRKESRALTAKFVQGARPGRAGTLVWAGERVRLVWNEAGIGVTIDAVCLGSGDEGDEVKARILRGGLMVHAIVVSAGTLRKTS